MVETPPAAERTGVVDDDGEAGVLAVAAAKAPRGSCLPDGCCWRCA
jgi:hypothetical protein